MDGNQTIPTFAASNHSRQEVQQLKKRLRRISDFRRTRMKVQSDAIQTLVFRVQGELEHALNLCSTADAASSIEDAQTIRDLESRCKDFDEQQRIDDQQYQALVAKNAALVDQLDDVQNKLDEISSQRDFDTVTLEELRAQADEQNRLSQETLNDLLSKLATQEQTAQQIQLELEEQLSNQQQKLLDAEQRHQEQLDNQEAQRTLLDTSSAEEHNRLMELNEVNQSLTNRVQELEEQLSNQQQQLLEAEQRHQVQMDDQDAQRTLLDTSSAEEHNRLMELNEVNQSLTNRVQELEVQIADLQQAQDRVQSTADFTAHASVNREQDLLLEIEVLKEQFNFLHEEANVQRSESVAVDVDSQRQIEELRDQLLESRHEAVELRMQNTDLADQVAVMHLQKSGHTTLATASNNESLSWEERKRLLLVQLESESDEEEPSSPRRLEIEDVIQTTEREIVRRDREIAELRSLIEEQSNVRGEVAVGAAAFAQMMESDEIIVNEREKLRQLQSEWEAKFRQAEIDASMERAKLARQRLELEEKQQEFELKALEHAKQAASDPSAKSSRGKWLARLGLHEETHK